MIQLLVPGEPIAQPRQRHGLVRGQIRNWTPAKHPVNVFKAALRLCWQQSAGVGIEGPVRLTIEAVFSRPKSLVWKKRPMPRVPHTKKPDAENVAKAVLDALNGLAYQDDSQVCELRVCKWIAAGGEAPYTRVVIEALDGALGLGSADTDGTKEDG